MFNFVIPAKAGIHTKQKENIQEIATLLYRVIRKDGKEFISSIPIYLSCVSGNLVVKKNKLNAKHQK